ncbi:phytoene/squalene synthase family protein [Sphingosinicella sp. BN140058]|nr:phytoene/squalene synthase family protein [Sphingosinicella sp. BN140058]
MSPPERAALVAEAAAIIGRGSKSFRLASRLFDRETRERAWLLYAWCRACDDRTDGQTLGHDSRPVAEPEQAFRGIADATDRALAGETVGDPPFDALAVVAAECAIPHAFIRAHLDGFALDAAGWRPANERDLLRYCFHVAGAVGCMMAVVMGVAPDDELTLDRASDLGIAFQLANIARDITEDCENGRCYIPAEWLAEAGLKPGDLASPAHRDRVAMIAGRLAALSERYELSGRAGAPRLPFRARWAVLAAASIYGAIGRKVAQRGAAALDSRVIIRKRRKLASVGLALVKASGSGDSVEREDLWTRPR